MRGSSGVLLTVQAALPSLRDKQVLEETDNKATQADVNHLGVRSRFLNSIARRLWTAHAVCCPLHAATGYLYFLQVIGLDEPCRVPYRWLVPGSHLYLLKVVRLLRRALWLLGFACVVAHGTTPACSFAFLFSNLWMY